ncbi:hypothetical protein [Thalassobacillus sp. CUG 92003]|uniref:hypothetical protein n=1 Tax=Thalassobacillus sp. CUG 92003 TaxID=2736641 RepID=UPI0015E7D9F4|nr:hypothetical protein [Thalassobacillus sp. CUG 92003]
MNVTCMSCQNEFMIDSKDPQYQKFKRGLTKYYTCKDGNRSIQGAASTSDGVNVNDLDPYDHILNRNK